MQLIIALGTLATKISNELLNEINTEIELINEIGINHEREQQHNLQIRERWITLSRDNRFRGRYRFREVCNNSIELLRGERHNKYNILLMTGELVTTLKKLNQDAENRLDIIMYELLQVSLKIENPEDTMEA